MAQATLTIDPQGVALTVAFSYPADLRLSSSDGGATYTSGVISAPTTFYATRTGPVVVSLLTAYGSQVATPIGAPLTVNLSGAQTLVISVDRIETPIPNFGPAGFVQSSRRPGASTPPTFAETIPRLLAGTDNAIAATGVCHATAVALQVGDVVSNITFVTGGTAAGTPTAGFAALYSSAATPALLAQTADFGSTARAANTAYTVPLAAQQVITTPGIYYVVISFTAGTVPTLRGVSVGNAVVAGAIGLSAKVLAQTHGSAVGAVAPATIATPTTVATPCYFALT